MAILKSVNTLKTIYTWVLYTPKNELIDKKYNKNNKHISTETVIFNNKNIDFFVKWSSDGRHSWQESLKCQFYSFYDLILSSVFILCVKLHFMISYYFCIFFIVLSVTCMYFLFLEAINKYKYAILYWLLCDINLFTRALLNILHNYLIFLQLTPSETTMAGGLITPQLNTGHHNLFPLIFVYYFSGIFYMTVVKLQLH